jgi:transposase InsO family protein
MDVATSMGVSVSTVYKWRRRYRAERVAGLQDRSSRPNASPTRTAGDVEAQVVALRRERRIYNRIAAETGVSRATVGRILTRHGLNRWRDLEPAEPVRRYERDRPGEMIHLDIKKLGRFDKIGHRITGDRHGQSNSRGVGWEFVHVCIDDHSRLGCANIMPDEKKESAIAALKAAIAWYASLGIAIERVMTDNGSCYRSKAFKKTCAACGVRHIFTKPYTPKTNGKAERFKLPYWLHHYNWHRPHAGIKGYSPISRAGLDVNNLMRLHS